MNVSGESAKDFDAVNLSSFSNINLGVLVSADEQSGEVVWTDKAGETKTVRLGMHAVKIVRRGR